MQGWVVIPQNVKKNQNHCTLLSMAYFLLWEKVTTSQYLVRVTLEIFYSVYSVHKQSKSVPTYIYAGVGFLSGIFSPNRDDF
jgi:hypothetical protein